MTTSPAHPPGAITHVGSPERLHPTNAEWDTLGKTGYVPLEGRLPSDLIDHLPCRVDRLIAAGDMMTPKDRIVAGQPTEHLLSLGTLYGRPLGSRVFQGAPWLACLFQALQGVGESFNARRAALLAQGLVAEHEAPEVAVEGMELNLNRVVHGWTGLHPHQDHHRFTQAARRIDRDSTLHRLQGARVLTVSGYARPAGPDGRRMDDLGGALTFYLRPHERGPADGAIHDVVAARHGSAAIFLARTVHGVSRMHLPGSVRYSFQAFFPARSTWEALQPHGNAA